MDRLVDKRADEKENWVKVHLTLHLYFGKRSVDEKADSLTTVTAQMIQLVT